MPAENRTNDAIVRRWFAGFATGMTDFDELVHPDFVNHAAPPAFQHGAATFRRIIDAVLAAGGADGRYEITHLIADGDLVSVFTIWHGTHAASWLGVPATGRHFSTPQAHIFRLRDGRLAEHWAVRDDLSFFKQVGAR